MRGRNAIVPPMTNAPHRRRGENEDRDRGQPRHKQQGQPSWLGAPIEIGHSHYYQESPSEKQRKYGTGIKPRVVRIRREAPIFEKWKNEYKGPDHDLYEPSDARPGD